MGTKKYNQKLERRATAVKAEFERLGVTTDAIAASGFWQEYLMNLTADQVREAQKVAPRSFLAKSKLSVPVYAGLW